MQRDRRRRNIMHEKELLSQLHNLKKTSPDAVWKNGNRDILLSQISNGEPLVKMGLSETLKNLFVWKSLEWATQPAGVLLLIFAILAGGSFASVKIAKDAKPGDSLYIAKIISEKTQQAITFNEKAKTRLGIEFASNRAKEMAQVMTGSEGGEEADKLEDSFKKEISTVKNRLEKMGLNDQVAVTPAETPANEDETVFSADSGKTDVGLQISESPMAAAPVAVTSPKAALEEAEKLFEQKDYEGTLSKLEEVQAIISNPETIEAPAAAVAEPAQETATRTEPVIEPSATGTVEAAEEE